MDISAEQFKEIVAASRRQESDRRGEKRDAVRMGVRYNLTVRPIIPGINVAATPFTARLRDISAKGVGLICPVAVVAKFTLEMKHANGVLYVVNCDAKSCRSIDDEQFEIGAVFVGE